jgi:hypothetical protein
MIKIFSMSQLRYIYEQSSFLVSLASFERPKRRAGTKKNETEMEENIEKN